MIGGATTSERTAVKIAPQYKSTVSPRKRFESGNGCWLLNKDKKIYASDIRAEYDAFRETF
jgi:5-methyltetrahydrofolate--homocysteine methyltransferase